MALKISGRQKIQLLHNYDTIQPLDLNNIDCDSAYKAIALALYSLDEGRGNTLAEIQAAAAILCPMVTANQVEAALEDGVKKSLFMPLYPLNINWERLDLYPTCRYTFNPKIDKFERTLNRTLVNFLVGLVGGTPNPGFNRTPEGRKLFDKFFKRYADPNYGQPFQIFEEFLL